MLQPIIGGALAVQTLGWTGLTSVFSPRLWRRRTAVPKQSSRPHAVLSRGGHPVAILGMKKGPIQTLHQPIPPSAGARCLWGIIALPQRIACFAQGQGTALHHAVRACRLGPCPHAPQTLGKSAFPRSVLRLPHPLVDLSTRVAPRLRGPIPAVEQRMENTAAPRALGAQGLPRAWRGLPAIGLDGLRRLRGIHRRRFAGQNARRFCHVARGG